MSAASWPPREILDELIRDNHEVAALRAERVLETMRENLRLAREHLSLQQSRYPP